MRDATLAVRVVMLDVSMALFSMSWARMVFSIVAATASLSRYPLSFANVASEIVASSPVITTFATPVVIPAANICRLWAM